MLTTPDPEFKKSACILCSINCGLDIQTGGEDGRELLKIKGDKDHVSSQGYLCNKAARLNHYQSGADRLTSPLRRKADGSYEPVDWDTAIREVAAGLKGIKYAHGGDKIYFIGGGGQGNHLGIPYGRALADTLGVKYYTNALAQEKTGEFWVQGKMFGGAGPHGDFEHANVAVFIGKNPWQSHGFPRTRKILNDIAKDPDRTMIVIDPVLTRTARMADYHLRLKPGTDAWCLSAMIATIIQEGLYDKDFITSHVDGFEPIKAHFENVDISAFAKIADVNEDLLREAARVIARTEAASVFEDLGIQQNVHSTLSSYLQRIMWVICGHFAKKGTQNIALSLTKITDRDKSKKGGASDKYKKSPVLGRRVITGLLPCNEVPDEILTVHPDRFRAAVIMSANPVHSYANTPRMREALEALEFTVVIDVAMTETARIADYILPAASQYEKHECTFFSAEFPGNHFHLRHPIVDPLPSTMAEPEMLTRLIEELGAMPTAMVSKLRRAAKWGRKWFAFNFLRAAKKDRSLMKIAPALLYRTLGPTLGNAASAAPFWGLCHQFAQKNRGYAINAGFSGSAFKIGEDIFNKLISEKSGFTFGIAPDYSDSWKRVGYPDGKIRLHLEELFPQVIDLDESPLKLPKGFDFILAAGQRRGGTANTIIRDPSWDRKKDMASLWIHPKDADKLKIANGDNVRISTQTGSAETYVEVTDKQRPGTLAIPNGLGIDYGESGNNMARVGIAPNELTSSDAKDFFAGTPWHKFVPAKLEKVI